MSFAHVFYEIVTIETYNTRDIYISWYHWIEIAKSLCAEFFNSNFVFLFFNHFPLAILLTLATKASVKRRGMKKKSKSSCNKFHREGKWYLKTVLLNHRQKKKIKKRTREIDLIQDTTMLVQKSNWISDDSVRKWKWWENDWGKVKYLFDFAFRSCIPFNHLTPWCKTIFYPWVIKCFLIDSHTSMSKIDCNKSIIIIVTILSTLPELNAGITNKIHGS